MLKDTIMLIIWVNDLEEAFNLFLETANYLHW